VINATVSIKNSRMTFFMSYFPTLLLGNRGWSLSPL
jgi:hypothetical protein